MRRQLNAVVVAWLVGILLAGTAPAHVLAAPAQSTSLQAAEVDPAIVALIQAGVAAAAPFVEARSLPAAAAVAVDVPDVTPAIRPAPQPDPAGPQGEPTPETPEDAPETAALEPVEYSDGEITFLAPGNWNVTEGNFGVYFEMAAPGSDFIATIEEAPLDAPGLLGVVFFVIQTDVMISEYLEGATLLGVEAGLTSQQLPVVKLDLTTEVDGIEGRGVAYLFSSGLYNYFFFAAASSAEWDAIAPGVELVADSITFDPSLITITATESDGLVYGDEQGVLEVTLPADWLVSETGDSALPVLVADMSYTFVGALGIETPFVEEVGAEALDEMLNPPNAESDPDAYSNLIDALAAFIAPDGGEVTLAPEMSVAFPHDGAVTVRLAGEGNFGATAVVPVVIYFDVRGEDVVFMITFGETETVFAQEDALLEIVRSIVVLE